MSVIVTDAGFAADDWTGPACCPLADLSDETPDVLAVELAPTDDPRHLAQRLGRIEMIRIAFPSFSDGRGFGIARRLRLMGFQGRLRAAGPLIADQYDMARRSGFDEVEISDAVALRQPEDQWLARADWHGLDYQARLRA